MCVMCGYGRAVARKVIYRFTRRDQPKAMMVLGPHDHHPATEAAMQAALDRAIASDPKIVSLPLVRKQR